MGIIASRDFNLAYIILDSVFILLLMGLLCWRRRYLTTLWGLFGGILYFFVDYCIFHLWTGSRSIEGGNMFWTLLWMSMSYGFTNFAWIWLCLDKDRDIREWTILIFSWWIACPMIAGMIPSPVIHIQRTTGAYHGIMGAILFLSYLGVSTTSRDVKRSPRSTSFGCAQLVLPCSSVGSSLCLLGISAARESPCWSRYAHLSSTA